MFGVGIYIGMEVSAFIGNLNVMYYWVDYIVDAFVKIGEVRCACFLLVN